MKIKLKTPSGARSFVVRKREPVPEAESIKTGLITQKIPEKADEYQEIKEISPQGIALPQIKFTEMEEQPDDMDTSRINVKYLLPSGKNGDIAIYAHIYWDPKTHELVYNVMEPPLDEDSKTLLKEIKAHVQEKIDIDFSRIKRQEAVDYLIKIFEKALDFFHVKEKREIIRYYIFRDFLGMEVIEPFLNDKYIEDISCDGFNIPLYVYHRDPRIGSLRTNVIFENSTKLDSFVKKLAERCGKVISVAKPLLDATLPDGSRVQATLGSDIARQGSNFTIRMFTEKPMTPTDMVKFGTCDIRMMAYYWYLIENGASILISGGTATGKTTFLNVLSLFIKPQMKIVSIEDTAELRLPHPHWVPEVARAPIAETGAVDMFELLRESLRQRPDYIIVGEVRGKEAYVLFQQMAVGHPGLSTIHAENLPKLLDRLTTPPISLTENLIQNLDVIIFLKRIKKGNKYKRRITTSLEILGYDKKTNTPLMNKLFSWEAKTNRFITLNSSVLLRTIAESNGIDEKEVRDEIEKRAKVLEWMYSKNITDYLKISKILNLFYTSQDYLMARIEATL